MKQEREDTILLIKKAGLTDSQAKAYLTFVNEGKLTPNDLSKLIDESRSNCYAICDKLEKYNLIEKTDDKKAAYKPNHPVTLETLAEKRRKLLTRHEKEVKEGISNLIDIFYANNQMPGARTIYGRDSIREVYKDILRVGKDNYLIRTPKDSEYGGNYLKGFLSEKAERGIYSYVIAAAVENSIRNYQDGSDKERLIHKTFIPKDFYDAPVEIDVYGDRVAFTSFGDVEMVTFITSPALAEAMRQIIKIIIRLQKDYMKNEEFLC